MKIGLNATCFNDRPSGAKQRFIGLYTELFKQLENDQFVVYEPIDCRIGSWFDNPENVIFRQTPLLSENRWQKYFRGLFYWPSVLKTEQFDVFEGFHQPVVIAPTGITLFTIHDIRRIAQNEYWHWRERAIYNSLLKHSLKSADHVIAVSESASNEIHDVYPQIPILVIYNGVDIHPFQNISGSELSRVQKSFNLPEQFLLAVGHFEKRKNYLNLVDAIAKLHSKGRIETLVIIGNDSGEMNAVKERVRCLKLASFVKIYNGLTDSEVRCFYKLSKLFVFPSSYEGFGIPVLEAMASSCPMVLSDIPVFREITQEQCLYFFLDNPVSIADVIEEALSSDSKRERLIQYGNDRVLDFSFHKTSMQLASVYKSLS